MNRNKECILEFDNFNRLLYNNKPIPEELEDVFEINVNFEDMKKENGNPVLEDVIMDKE